jgi:hypothetical protein
MRPVLEANAEAVRRRAERDRWLSGAAEKEEAAA